MLEDRTGRIDRFSLLFDMIGDPMAVININTFRLIEVNRAFKYVLGDEVLGKTLIELMHPEDVCRTEGKQTCQVLTGTYRFRAKKGGDVWLSLSSTAAVDGSNAYVIAHNITEEKQREQEFFRRAHYDVVTGLPNRHLFEDRVQQGIAAAVREDRKVALLFMDLDRFKAVNDTYGHAAGDFVLKVVASRLLNEVRTTDTVSRYAGDEFIIFLSMLRSTDEIHVVLERLEDAIQQPILIDIINPVQIEVGASFGSAIFPDDASDIDSLLATADERMYRQKRTGDSCQPITRK